MVRPTRNSQPPESSLPSPGGGASERSQLDWVLNSQSQMQERLAVIETNSEHTVKSLDRFELALAKQNEDLIASLDKQTVAQEKAFEKLCAIQEKSFDKLCIAQEKASNTQITALEKALDKQSVDIKKSDADIVSINKKLTYATGVLATVIIITGLATSGQFGKFFSFMEGQQEQNVPVVSEKSKKD